ncbi:MAG: acyl-CoA thioesterase II [Sphingopyxis sp.]
MTDEAPATTIEGRVAQLLSLLDVRASGELCFTGSRQPGGQGRVFGGQVIAQGLMAAMRTVEENRILHSLHCSFMRAGDEELEITYLVRPDFDGGSFSTRRIIAEQVGRPILTMTASFHKLEPGFAHQDAMPDVPPPEDLLNENQRIEAETDPATAALMTRFQRARPIEIRPVEDRSFLNPSPAPAFSHAWMRLGAPLSDLPLAQALAVNGDDANLHRAILAYASDMMLLGTSLLPHGVNWRTAGMMSASLDHAVWLHDDFRIDDWLLYATDSPWAGRGRGFNRGRFYTRDGRLVASCAQEGLIRLRTPKAG